MSLSEAFAQADEELSGGTDEPAEDNANVPDEPSSEVEPEHVSEATDTAGHDSSEAESVFDRELFEDSEADDQPALDFDMTVTPDMVNGLDEPVTLREMADGYLRQADYTRKTQQLAAERESLEQAQALWEAVNDDPAGVARALAERVGLIEADATAAKPNIELSQFKTAEEVEKEIQRRVDEELENHPDLQKASELTAKEAVEGELDRIGEKFGVALSREDRDFIIDEAIRRQTGDLELVFQAMLADQQRRAAQREQVRKGAGGRPTARDDGDAAPPPEVKSVADAFELALAEHDG